MGNAVILKPDVQTPIAGGVTFARLLEEAGLPDGLFHVLPGGPETGAALVKEPLIDMISFTGSFGRFWLRLLRAVIFCTNYDPNVLRLQFSLDL
jgi:delta 1-pyrroline-5-carboxylate dehydrogenase